MNTYQGVLLKQGFNNRLQIRDEVGWFMLENNPSTGYKWHFRPDDSDVYELMDEISLHPSVANAVGVPGLIIWRFVAIMYGHGKAAFELYPPGGNIPSQTIEIMIEGYS